MLRIKQLLLTLACFLGQAIGQEQIGYQITDIDRYGKVTLMFSKPIDMDWLSTESNFYEMFTVYWMGHEKPGENQQFVDTNVEEFKSDKQTVILLVTFEHPYYIGLYNDMKETVHIDVKPDFDVSLISLDDNGDAQLSNT